MTIDADIANGILSKRIRELMEKQGLTKADLSKDTGVPAATIGYIVDGSTYNPRIATLLTIANCLNVSIDYLVGSPCEKSEVNIESKRAPAPAVERKENQVPLLDWRDINNWIKHGGEFLKSNSLENVTIESKTSKKGFAVKMSYQTQGIFPRNSIIIADPKAKYGAGDYVLASIRGGTPIIKRIYREHDNYYLNSVGANLLSLEIDTENQVVGKILENHVFFN